MPQSQKEQKKKSAEPSKSLLQRWFGSSEMTPNMQEAIRIARQENPDLANVEPYGPLSRLFMGSALGYTSPGKTIYLNPEMLQYENPQDIADTIVHENVHARQMKNRGLSPTKEFLNQMFKERLPYGQRPDEMEAFEEETKRRSRMNRMQTATPSFLTNEFKVPQDIRIRR